MTSVYKPLKLYFLMVLASTVLGLLKGIPVLGVVFAILGFVSDIVLLYAMYQLSPASSRLTTAFHLNIAGIVACAVGGLLALVPFVGAAIVLIGLVLVVISDYYFFYGLDDLVTERGYQYPAGQIKWCFYLAIIAVVVTVGFGWVPFVGGFIGSVVSLLVSLAQIYLLYKYVEAVKLQEA